MTRSARVSRPSIRSGPSGPAVAPAASSPVAAPRARDHHASERENGDQRGANDQHGGDRQPEHAALDAIALERADGRRGRVALRAARADLLRVWLSTVLHGTVVRLGWR